MKKIALAFCLFVCANIFAQNKQTKLAVYTTAQEREKCLSHEYEMLLRQKYPNQFGTKESFEENLSRVIEERQATAHLRAGEIRVMPIIFHVIHGAGTAVGTAENISAAQIQSQVDVLNEDYRRILGTPGHNTNPVGADTELQFCLATVDQYGNCLAEPGIMRWDDWGAGPFPALPTSGPDPIEEDIKPCTIQDPERFLNYWVIDMDGGTLGYAQFPDNSGLGGLNASGGAANTDGVVCGPTFTGRIGNVNATYSEGRTATHEVGHWLGLRHIWGDGGCGVDDFCADTPESDAANFGCATGHVSCGSVDMVENYMDYSDDACFNIFTIDQKARIDAVLAMSPRRPYSISTVDPPAVADLPAECNPAPLPAASFQINGKGISIKNNCDANAFTPLSFCRDSETPTLTIIDESTSCAAGITSWAWDFGDGNTSTMPSPTHTYLTDGIFDISLTVTDANGTSTRNLTAAVIVTSGAECTPTCNTTANNTSVTIPTTAATVTSTLNVSLGGNIADINLVNLTGNHTYFSDLTFTLTSENGVSVVLLASQCGTQNVSSFNFTFDDSATGTLTCGGTINANLQPVGSLSDFIGLPAAGLWTLTVTDSFNDDGGAITGWGLEICTLVPTCSATITAISATEDVCTGTTAADFATAEASITYSAGASTDFLLEWFDDAAFTTAATALPTATSCTRATKTYYLRATCIADATVQNGGTLTVTVYPTPQAPTINDDTANCSITITPACGAATDVPDVLSFAGPLDYSGQTAGALDITGATVTNAAGVCTAATYDVTHGNGAACVATPCDANCGSY